MSIDFQQALAAAMAGQQTNSAKKAEFWCNLGVKISEDQFVAIGGFPLDTITQMTGSSTFAATHNALTSMMLERAKTLNPGQNLYINAGEFTLQLKRIGGEKSGTTAGAVIAPALAALFA